MSKKLTKHGKSLALIINKPILEALGITDSTELQLIVAEGTLIVKPKKKNIKAQKQREKDISKTAHAILDKYEAVFKKLAKT